MRLTTFALAALAAAAIPTALPEGDRIIRLYEGESHLLGAELVSKVQSTLSELDVWGTTEDGAMEIRIQPHQNASHAFLTSTFRTEDSTQFHRDHFAWFDENYGEQVCQEEAEVCAAAPTFYNNYQLKAAIDARINSIRDANPARVRDFDWGASHLGARQNGMIVGTEGNNKPIVFYFCGEHSREWIPPMFCTYMIETLATSQEPDVVALLNRFDFYILPVMNPDGYAFTHSDNRMWRKSRRPNPSNPSCIGTDLNRNYAFQWNTGGASNNPCSDTYHGGTPNGFFNNVETANLRDWMERFGDRVVAQVDVHAYGQMWMHPWGYTTALPSDEPAMRANGQATVNAIRGVNGLSFRMGSISRIIYVASGSSCDWFYGQHGVTQAWAPEVRGTSFQPPASNIVPSNNELWAGMIAQVTMIGNQMDAKASQATE